MPPVLDTPLQNDLLLPPLIPDLYPLLEYIKMFLIRHSIPPP